MFTRLLKIHSKQHVLLECLQHFNTACFFSIVPALHCIYMTNLLLIYSKKINLERNIMSMAVVYMEKAIILAFN